MKKRTLKKVLKAVKAQGSISPVFHSTKKFAIKGLGFLIFLIGGVFIMSSYFEIPIITGQVISEPYVTTASVSGILLEIIGIVLMAIKVGNCESEENHK